MTRRVRQPDTLQIAAMTRLLKRHSELHQIVDAWLKIGHLARLEEDVPVFDQDHDRAFEENFSSPRVRVRVVHLADDWKHEISHVHLPIVSQWMHCNSLKLREKRRMREPLPASSRKWR